MESLGLAGEAKLNCNTLRGKWTGLQVCKHGCKTVKGICTTKKSVDWHGLRIRLGGHNGNANVKCELFKQG